MTGLAEFGVRSISNVDIIRLKWLKEELDRDSDLFRSALSSGSRTFETLEGRLLPARSARAFCGADTRSPPHRGQDPIPTSSTAVDDEIRARINQAVEILIPLAKRSGALADLQALRIAIMIATHALERAALLAKRRLDFGAHHNAATRTQGAT